MEKEIGDVAAAGRARGSTRTPASSVGHATRHAASSTTPRAPALLCASKTPRASFASHHREKRWWRWSHLVSPRPDALLLARPWHRWRWPWGFDPSTRGACVSCNWWPEEYRLASSRVRWKVVSASVAMSSCPCSCSPTITTLEYPRGATKSFSLSFSLRTTSVRLLQIQLEASDVSGYAQDAPSVLEGFTRARWSIQIPIARYTVDDVVCIYTSIHGPLGCTQRASLHPNSPWRDFFEMLKRSSFSNVSFGRILDFLAARIAASRYYYAIILRSITSYGWCFFALQCIVDMDINRWNHWRNIIEYKGWCRRANAIENGFVIVRMIQSCCTLYVFLYKIKSEE